MISAYLWIKALHVIAMVAWMAGMLYLPRLFVYHAAAQQGSDVALTLEVMERRLMRFIMLPALLVTWLSGVALAIEAGFFNTEWLQVKLLLVVALTALHGYFALVRKTFVARTNRRQPRFYRMINEVPTVLLIAIVVLVITKPF
jgi:putative membrane protein